MRCRSDLLRLAAGCAALWSHDTARKERSRGLWVKRQFLAQFGHFGRAVLW